MRAPTWSPDRRVALRAEKAEPGKLYFTKIGDVVIKLPVLRENVTRKLSRFARAELRRVHGRAPHEVSEWVDRNAGLWEWRPRNGSPVRLARMKPGELIWSAEEVSPELRAGLMPGRDPRMDPYKGDELFRPMDKTTYTVGRVDARRGIVWLAGTKPRPLSLADWRGLWHCATKCNLAGEVKGTAAAPASGDLTRPFVEEDAEKIKKARAEARRARPPSKTRAPRCRNFREGEEAHLENAKYACSQDVECLDGRWGSLGLGPLWERLNQAKETASPGDQVKAWEALHAALHGVKPRKKGKTWQAHPALLSHYCGDNPEKEWDWFDEALHAADPRTSPAVPF